MRRLLHKDEGSVGPVDPFVGTYTAAVGGGECVVVLVPGPGGRLGGSFTAEGQTLEVSGMPSRRTGQLSGFLLESTARTPVALFRARLEGAELSVEIEVPDLEELLEQCRLEGLEFSRLGPPSEGAGE